MKWVKTTLRSLNVSQSIEGVEKRDNEKTRVKCFKIQSVGK